MPRFCLQAQTSRPSPAGLFPTVQITVTCSSGVLNGRVHWRVAAANGPESVATAELEATCDSSKIINTK
jgi:hypothetical protein